VVCAAANWLKRILLAAAAARRRERFIIARDDEAAAMVVSERWEARIIPICCAVSIRSRICGAEGFVSPLDIATMTGTIRH
jgi:hypothetical protein